MKNYKTKGLLGNLFVNKLVQRGYRFDSFINGFVSNPFYGYRVALIKTTFNVYQLMFIMPNDLMVEPSTLTTWTDINTYKILEDEVTWLREEKFFS